MACAGIAIVRGSRPVLDVSLNEEESVELVLQDTLTYSAVNPLYVMGALSIAVTRSVGSTSGIARVLGGPTIGVHLNKVKSAVKATRKARHVDVKGKLLIFEAEQLVIAIIFEEVDAGANIGRVRALGYELQGEGRIGGRDTVGPCVVGTVDGAVGGTCIGIGAEGVVPFVAGVAVRRTRDLMCPPPIGVKYNRTRLEIVISQRRETRRAAHLRFASTASGALLDIQRRVRLRR